MVAGFAPLLCPPLRIGRICEFKIWNGIWDRKLRKKLRERFSVDLNFLIKNIGIFNVSGWWDIYYTFERSEEVDDEWLLRHWGERSVYVYSQAIKVTAKLSFASVVDRSPVAQCYANTLRDNLESISVRDRDDSKLCSRPWLGRQELKVSPNAVRTNMSFKLSFKSRRIIRIYYSL